MIKEHSYGIIPLHKRKGVWHVLLIQHGSAGYWGFPKGHAEAKEDSKEAAIRELHEETGLNIRRFLSDEILEENYFFFFEGKRINKTVSFYVAEVSGKVELQSEEVRDSKWIPLTTAVNHLTYPTDQAICRRVLNLLTTETIPKKEQ
jgi:bis(5'-nucleosidyl)-tetraphosphatase